MAAPLNSKNSFLRKTLYGTLALPRLLQALNSPRARDDNVKAVVLSLRANGLKQAKGLFNKLYKIEGDEQTELQKAVDAWLCSSQPQRLKECKKCQRFFFDRSRRNSGRQCDGCQEQTVTDERLASRLATNPVDQRKIPSIDELERLLLLGNDREHRHGVRKILADGSKEYDVYEHLVTSCKKCGHDPRTFLMTFWLVQSHNNFWKGLVNDLPETLQDMFNARWMESPRTLTGRRHASLALAWCIREADHWLALSRVPFVQQTEKWIAELQIPTWKFLDLTYVPTYNLSFLQKVSKAAHQSSRKRKNASDYWGRGGITRYAGTITSQGFWTACAGPLSLHLRPQIHGKTWDEKQTVPRALWKEILKLWSLRYPERELPTSEALRRRVVSKQRGKGFLI